MPIKGKKWLLLNKFARKNMLKVYGIPNCDTVKKTLDYLKDKGEPFEFYSYKNDGLEAEKLKNWIKQVPLDKLVNKKSTTYKALTEEEKVALEDKKAAVKVILANTSVIKRPLIEKDGKVLTLGFNKELYDKLLS